MSKKINSKITARSHSASVTPAKQSKPPRETKTPTSRHSLLRSLFWTIALCIWIFLALELSSLFFAWLLNTLIGRELLLQPLWTTIYNILAYSGALLLAMLVPWKLFHRAHPTRTELGLRSTPTWVDLGLTPVAFVVYFLAAGILTWIFQQFSWFDISQAQNVGYDSYLMGSDLIIAFISLVIVAPVAEELIFRGHLYGRLRTRLPASLATLVVSLLFAFVHLGADPAHLQWNVAVNVFALSLILCALREITGTVYAGIFTHMLKNGIAFYLLYVAHMV